MDQIKDYQTLRKKLDSRRSVSPRQFFAREGESRAERNGFADSPWTLPPNELRAPRRTTGLWRRRLGLRRLGSESHELKDEEGDGKLTRLCDGNSDETQEDVEARMATIYESEGNYLE